jgi:hypothetical protein
MRRIFISIIALAQSSRGDAISIVRVLENGHERERAASSSDADRSFVRRAAFIKIRLPAKHQVIRAAQRDGDCDPEKKVL